MKERIPKGQSTEHLPSRRGVLFGAAAVVGLAALGETSAAAESVAESTTTHWGERAVLSPENKELYAKGLEELRIAAETLDHEIKKVFIVYPDGKAIWHDVPMKQVVEKNAGSTFAVNQPDTDAWYSLVAEAKKKAVFVEDFHTHPLQFQQTLPPDIQGEQLIRDKQDFRRVPPGPADLWLQVVGSSLTAGFNEDSFARLRYKVVTPDGTWESRPRSFEVMQRFHAAINKPLAALSPLQEVSVIASGLAAANYLRTSRPDAQSIIPLLEQDFSQIYRNKPTLLPLIGPIVTSLLHDKGLPQDGRLYLEILDNARTVQMDILRELDPHTDGLIANAPEIGDSFAKYTERWSRLHVDLTFTPFEKA